MKTKLLLSVTTIFFAYTTTWAQSTSYGGLQGLGTTAGTLGDNTNAYFGHEAGLSNTGTANTFIGSGSGFTNTTGAFNTFLGYQSGFLNTGSNSTFAGYQSGYSNTTGVNTFLGYRSGYANATGTGNTFVGNVSGENSTGSDNTFIGDSSGQNNIGDSNTFVGHASGQTNTTGFENTFIGRESGQANTDGNSNAFMGYQSGYSNTTGSNNTFVGYWSGYNNQTGSGNVFLGYRAGENETGSDYLYIDNSNTSTPLIWGDFANDMLRFNGSVRITGIDENVANDLTRVLVTDVDGNIWWRDVASLADGVDDADADPNNERLSSAILNEGMLQLDEGGVITEVDLSPLQDGFGNHLANENINLNNQWLSGDGDDEGIYIDNNGNVGIGTVPHSNAALDVNGAVKIGSAISTLPQGYNLYVEAGILTERVKIAVKDSPEWTWPDYVFEKDYPLKTLPEVAQFIAEHQHLPGMPSAAEVLSDGIDVARMDARLLEKIEELMLYKIQQNNMLKQQQELMAAQADQNTRQQQQIQLLLQQNKNLLKRIKTLENK